MSARRVHDQTNGIVLRGGCASGTNTTGGHTRRVFSDDPTSLFYDRNDIARIVAKPCGHSTWIFRSNTIKPNLTKNNVN